MIKIFDVIDNKLTITEHCYTLGTLKAIMDKYPDNYIKVYLYVFYMACPDPDLNPFFNMTDVEKEPSINHEIGIDFSLDDPIILDAIKFCDKLYETPTFRAYRGMKTMLDRLADYMENTPLTHGRDGNINSVLRAGKDFEAIRKSFKGVYQDLMEEQGNRNRGGAEQAYDSGKR